MSQPYFKDAITICKSIMRNGFDAHVVNTALQHYLIEATGITEIDIATDASFEDLSKILPGLTCGTASEIIGTIQENSYLYRFYRMHISDAAHPEIILTRLTPTILQKMLTLGDVPASLISGMNSLVSQKYEKNIYPGFYDFSSGFICFEGLADQTLLNDYSLGIRALRYSANFALPIEPNSWIAIIRAARRIIEYTPIALIMDEWRRVEAENMWKFVELLYDSQILHGLLPEVASLSTVRQTKNDTGVEESVLEHTIETMRHYPAGEFYYDWLGTFAMMFHDVGKLFTAEHYQGRWTFYEHHRVGAKVTRKILRRLNIFSEDIDLICRLVQNHMRFQFMMTDKGIRNFTAQEDYIRLIEMSRANIIARDDNFTAFNHNNKYLTRAETPEQMLEPFLNGNEIMEVTGLKPGPHVGEIRQALLKAQIAGEVTSRDDAICFAHEYTI